MIRWQRGGGGLTRGSIISYRVGEDFSKIEENSTAFIEDLDSRFDFEIFPDGDVEGV